METYGPDQSKGTQPGREAGDRVGISAWDASLFFRLLSRRYERGSLIVTSNKGFIDWGEVFSDPVLATAILDRLLHQSVTINIKGDSYRLKEKRRAGLLGRTTPQQADAEIQQQKEVA